MTNMKAKIQAQEPENGQVAIFKRVSSALFYGLASFMITVINKTVLTYFGFPSFQFLGLGQMVATVIVLFVAKKCKVVSFPDFERGTFKKIWPLPLIYVGNMIFGLGGTKELSLPMFTALRRFSILMTMIAEYYILSVKPTFSVQMIQTPKLRIIQRMSTLTNKIVPLSTQQPKTQVSNDFEEEFSKHHISTSLFQKMLLGLGSAAVCIMDPTRPEMIACMGEATGNEAMKYMLTEMEKSPEGSEILRKRPRINSNTVDLVKLKEYPEGTLGKVYVDFLEKNRVTPDSRGPVNFVEDINLAYVMQRYREVHDLVHTILLMPTNMIGEITVKWVEGIQTKLPMCIGGAMFGPLRLKPKNRETYKKYYLPWAIRTGMEAKFLLNVHYEKRWEQPLDELHEELNITPLKIPKE